MTSLLAKRPEAAVKTRAVLTGIGLATGIALYTLHKLEARYTLDDWNYAAAVVFALTAGTALMLTYRITSAKASILYAGALAVIVGVMFFFMGLRFDNNEGHDVAWQAAVLAALILTQISLPFFLHWHRTHNFRPNYVQLFEVAWHTPVVVTIAGAFTGAVWLVLLLWLSLFNLIGIDFFEQLFEKAWFAYPISGAAFGLAVAVLQDWHRVIDTVHGLVRGLLKILAPVLAAITVMFLVSLPFTGLQKLWDTGFAASLLLATISLAILLINAVIDRHEEREAESKLLSLSAAVLVAVMPFFAGLAAAALMTRINQYGLTPQRFYAGLIVAVGVIYSFGYAVGLLLRRRDWQGWVREKNIPLAAFVAVLALVICTPILNAERISAAHQKNRLLSGKVSAEELDYRTLQYRWGKAGREALEELAQAENHPEQAIIADNLARVKEAGSYWATTPSETAAKRNITALVENSALQIWPKDAVLPDGLDIALSKALTTGHAPCNAEYPHLRCYLILQDFDDSGVWEAVLITSGWPRVIFFAFDDNRWISQDFSDDAKYDWTALANSFAAGDIEVISPRYKHLRIGDKEFPFAIPPTKTPEE